MVGLDSISRICGIVSHCGKDNWTTLLLIICGLFSYNNHVVCSKDQFLRRYIPIQYGHHRRSYQTIRRLDGAVVPAHSLSGKTFSSTTLYPRRSLIYKVTQPIRVKKKLTEVNGKLVYKLPPQQPSISSPSHSTRNNFLINRNIIVDEAFDVSYPRGHTSSATHGTRHRPTGSVEPSSRKSQTETPGFITSQKTGLHMNRFSSNRYNNRNYSYPSLEKPQRTADKNNRILSNIVPPPGLRMVIVNQDQSQVDLRSSTRYRTDNSNRISSSPNFRHPKRNKLSPTISTRKVLRIEAANMDEARAIVAKIGPGFKVRVLNETAPTMTTLQVVSSLPANTVTTPYSSTSDKVPTTSLTTTTTNHNLWWKGQNVCVKESHGLFGLSEEIWKKIQTSKSCHEKRHKYVCIEKYGFGANSPSKSITYRCCQGYVISFDRRRCEARSKRQKVSRTRPGRKLISRKKHKTNTVKTRSSSIDLDVLTIFMPSDDVVRAAFPGGRRSQTNDENLLVQSFLENHVIPNRKLLSSQLHNNQILTAVSGNPIRINFYRFDFENIMTANCRKIITPDVSQENSVIHFTEEIIEEINGTIFDYLNERQDEFSSLISVLEAVGILSQLRNLNNSYTIFLSTNEAFQAFPLLQRRSKSCLQSLALNHIVNTVICTAGTEIRKRKTTTLQGEEIYMHANQQDKFIGEARIISEDIMTSNGVIHIIDRVLEPSSAATVLDVLQSNSEYSSALELFQAADITEGLVTGSNFTLIVPSNRAFKRVSKRALMHLRQNPEQLASTVMFHLVPNILNFDGLQSNQAVETLFPPHNLHTSSYSMKIKISSSSAKRRYVKKPAKSLQCARVINNPDAKPCNGELLVVDQILKPPSGSLLSALMYSKTSNFSTLLTAIKNAGLEQIFDGNEVLTLFAPSDVAFSRFPPRVTQRLLSNKKLLIRVLKFHLIPGYQCEHELLQKPTRHRTLLRSTVLSCPKHKRVYLGRRRKKLRAKILRSNMQATNGIIHEIDNLLMPKKFKLF